MQRQTIVTLGVLAMTTSACGTPEGTPTTTIWMPTVTAADDDDADGDGDADDDGSGGDASGDGDDGGDDDGGPGSPTGHTAGDDGDDSGGPGGDVPELGGTFTVVATAADGLDIPRDLEFAPEHPDQLWVANAGFHGVVILFDAGGSGQQAEPRADPYGQHFMATVSSIAFGADNKFASCQESRDEWNGVPQPPDDFMGPTLWDADLDIFAVYEGGEGSHLDMLHQSPLCMGIAWETGNAYWAFDGLNAHLVRYDFKSDHGPGGSDHTDASIRRYLNAVVERRGDVPGHMVLDPDARVLYVADTGSGRVMALDIDSGNSNGELSGNWDGAGEYSSWDGASWAPVVTDLSAPSGLALADGRLFVTDFDTSEIIAFDTGGDELGRVSTGAPGIMGATIGPDGKLWYVDGVADEVVRVDP